MTPLGEALMRAAIDYAGVFPPAQLSLGDAVAEYRSVRDSEYAWVVGPLVLRPEQLDAHVLDASVPLSVVVREASAGTIDAVLKRSESLRIVALELAPVAPADVAPLVAGIPGAIRCFIEIPPDEHAALLDAIAEAGASAKLRTGGVNASAFPSPESVGRFLGACHRRRLPWKATAGLHHARTGCYPFTYDAQSAAGRMFGFLNLHAAVALSRLGAPEPDVIALLADSSPDALAVDGNALSWRDYRISAADVRAARASCVSFGSCSLREPIADLQRLRLL